jgi:hypothetical protein
VVTLPLLGTFKKTLADPSRLYCIDPYHLEKISGATYHESSLFDEVTLTPRSGDCGKDLSAVNEGGVAQCESVSL